MKEIEKELEKYYDENLKNFGEGAKGVGWKNDLAQKKRFEQMLHLIREKNNFSINDLGCGLGDFLDFMIENKFEPRSYKGYDLSEKMIALALNKHDASEMVDFRKIENAAALEQADYTIASGIFNLKYSVTEDQWLEYIIFTLSEMNRNSSKGFAFNMLTKYSDKEFMQSHLYYADPLFFFDHCKKNHAFNIALLHDYNEYDFTITVKK